MLLLLNYANAFAQIEKGNFVLGGDAKYKHSRSGRNNADQVLLQPMAGIFINDHLLTGAGLTYTLFFLSGNYTSTYIGLSPFCRYYPARHFFIQGGYSYAVVTGSNDLWRDWYIPSRLGYDIFLNQFVALEPYLYFNYGRASTNVDYTYGNYGAYLSLQVFLETNKKKILRLRKQKHWEQ